MDTELANTLIQALIEQTNAIDDLVRQNDQLILMLTQQDAPAQEDTTITFMNGTKMEIPR